MTFGEAPDGSLLAGGDVGLYRLSGNHFEKLAADFNTISSAQGIQDLSHYNGKSNKPGLHRSAIAGATVVELHS